MTKVSLIERNGETVDLTHGRSFNKGSYALPTLRKSILELGLGRSIVVNSHNNVICGQKVLAESVALGIRKAVVVETTGDEIVIVKRIDVLPDSKKGYELQLIDNATATKNIRYDTDLILDTMTNHIGFDARAWNAHECITKELDVEELIKDSALHEQPKEKKVKQDICMQTTTLFD